MALELNIFLRACSNSVPKFMLVSSKAQSIPISARLLGVLANCHFFRWVPICSIFWQWTCVGLETSQSRVFFEPTAANCQTRWFFSDVMGSNLERWSGRACGVCWQHQHYDTFLSLRMDVSPSSPLVRWSKTTLSMEDGAPYHTARKTQRMAGQKWDQATSMAKSVSWHESHWTPLGHIGSSCAEKVQETNIMGRIPKPFAWSLGRNHTRENFGTLSFFAWKSKSIEICKWQVYQILVHVLKWIKCTSDVK